MKVGGIRQLVVTPELGYPEDDPSHTRVLHPCDDLSDGNRVELRSARSHRPLTASELSTL